MTENEIGCEGGGSFSGQPLGHTDFFDCDAAQGLSRTRKVERRSRREAFGAITWRGFWDRSKRGHRFLRPPEGASVERRWIAWIERTAQWSVLGGGVGWLSFGVDPVARTSTGETPVAPGALARRQWHLAETPTAPCRNPWAACCTSRRGRNRLRGTLYSGYGPPAKAGTALRSQNDPGALPCTFF